MSHRTDLAQRSLDLHRKTAGKIEIVGKHTVTNSEELALSYTPGVGAVSRAIAEDAERAQELTGKSNAVAIVSDGSAVLGLGNIGPEAALPVMEGKALLFKECAGVDAYPIVLSTQDEDKIVETVKAIAPGFSGINLEDISAPKCFAVEERLKRELDIPVFHDDQHGTAIVVLAGLINSLKLVGKEKQDIRVVINGAGAAGIAISDLLNEWGVGEMTLLDSEGVVSTERSGLTPTKLRVAKHERYRSRGKTLDDALAESDVFIGVSRGDLLTRDYIANMATDPIVFALANPDPEILPEEAHAGGAAVVATGRSDFPNQINNVLVFPGLFRGLLDSRVSDVTNELKLAAALGLANVVTQPSPERIIPDLFDAAVSSSVSEAVKETVL